MHKIFKAVGEKSGAAAINLLYVYLLQFLLLRGPYSLPSHAVLFESYVCQCLQGILLFRICQWQQFVIREQTPAYQICILSQDIPFK